MVGAEPGVGADDRGVPARSGRDSPGHHAAHARGRDGVAEQSDRRGVSRSRSARAQRALSRPRRVPHSRRGVRVLHVRRSARHFSPGSIEGAGAHTISLFSFSKGYGMASWRVGYMVAAGAFVGRRQQDSGHESRVSAGDLAARGAGRRAGRRARMPRLPWKRSTACAPSFTGELTRADVPCDTPERTARSTYFMRVRTDARPDDAWPSV